MALPDSGGDFRFNVLIEPDVSDGSVTLIPPDLRFEPKKQQTAYAAEFDMQLYFSALSAQANADIDDYFSKAALLAFDYGEDPQAMWRGYGRLPHSKRLYIVQVIETDVDWVGSVDRSSGKTVSGSYSTRIVDILEISPPIVRNRPETGPDKMQFIDQHGMSYPCEEVCALRASTRAIAFPCNLVASDGRIYPPGYGTAGFSRAAGAGRPSIMAQALIWGDRPPLHAKPKTTGHQLPPMPSGQPDEVTDMDDREVIDKYRELAGEVPGSDPFAPRPGEELPDDPGVIPDEATDDGGASGGRYWGSGPSDAISFGSNLPDLVSFYHLRAVPIPRSASTPFSKELSKSAATPISIESRWSATVDAVRSHMGQPGFVQPLVYSYDVQTEHCPCHSETQLTRRQSIGLF